MIDNYVRLFNLSWIEPWLAEALIIIASALVLSLILCKAIDFINGNN
jgi:hypothetical protein